MSILKKLIILFSILTCGITELQAQKVEMKKNKIIIDKQEILSFKFFDTERELAIYKLNTTEELIYVIYNENQTPGYFQDDYYMISFPTLKLKMETSKWDRWKKSIAWFYENGLFDLNGNLNPEKIQRFIEKYHEPISERKKR